MKAKSVVTVDPLDKWREQLRRGAVDRGARRQHRIVEDRPTVLRVQSRGKTRTITTRGQKSMKVPEDWVDPEKCQACMICARKCPVEGIIGGKPEKPDFSDQPVAVIKWVDGTLLDTVWRVDG